MSDMSFLESGLKAGGLVWVASCLAIFVPLWLKTAWPLWRQPGRRADFVTQSLLVLAAATLPLGSMLAGALVLREVASEQGFVTPELDDAAEAGAEVSVPAGATLPEGCR